MISVRFHILSYLSTMTRLSWVSHGDENTQSVHQGTYTSKTTDRPKGKIIPDDEGEYVDFYEEK